jgi:hypothetical protein
MTQTFHKGDLVHIPKLGSYMSHFPSERDAIVIGSYYDQFGHSSQSSYTLYLKGLGPVSWYEEHHFTFVRHAPELLQQWQKEDDEVRTRHSNLDWIFQNGPEVVEECYTASIQALANHLGCSDLWGAHGEGISLFENGRRTLALAKPYLLTHDKLGFLEFAHKTAPILKWADYVIG